MIDAITVWVVETDYKTYLGWKDDHPEEETLIFDALKCATADDAREYLTHARDHFQWEFGEGYPNLIKVSLYANEWARCPLQ